MDKYVEYCAHDERHHKIKLIIEIEKNYFEMLKYNVEHGQDYKPFEIIANGIPYENPQNENFGEWKIHERKYLKFGCNQCGNLTEIPSNFCPNCGAKMEKGAHDVKK